MCRCLFRFIGEAMGEENLDTKSDKATIITRAWRQGGPFTAEQRKEAMALFLEYLKKDPTVMLACEYAGINRSTVYRWKDKYTAFADDWGNAIERTKDVARSSIYTRGILGWEEKAHSGGQVVMEYEPVVSPEGYQQYDDRGRPLVYGGKPLLIRKYSDTLAMGYARANLPEYKEKQQIDLYQHEAEQAEKDKQAILADLDAAIANDKKSASQEKEL